MDHYFPASGVDVNVLIPPLVAMAISILTASGGVSGAVFILPFQMSVLDYTTPSVSATNFVYNIVAIPGGVYRYMREGRMFWPLTLVVVTGTVPGVFLGYFVRVRFLPDPRVFKLFVGVVMLYLGGRLLYGMTPWSVRRRAGRGGNRTAALERKFRERAAAGKREASGGRKGPGLVRMAPGLPAEAVVRTLRVGPGRVEYQFWGERFSFSTPGVFALALIVGVVGGAYGIGGGAIIAPFCVAVFGLPVYTVAGAALMGSFVTSVAGVTFYSLLPAAAGVSKSPDWALGLLFGAGGLVGLYLGARLQKYLPQRLIKLMLGVVLLYLAVDYVARFFG